MIGDVSGFLLTQGVLGIACLVLGTVVYYQNKKYDKLQEKYDNLQERRYAESQADKEKLVEPIKEQTRLSEKIYDALIGGRQG